MFILVGIHINTNDMNTSTSGKLFQWLFRLHRRSCPFKFSCILMVWIYNNIGVYIILKSELVQCSLSSFPTMSPIHWMNSFRCFRGPTMHCLVETALLVPSFFLSRSQVTCFPTFTCLCHHWNQYLLDLNIFAYY